jgi:hypothetical protein
MLQDIKMKGVEHLVTAPVIKWAQSESQIYISFKLSHRQDSPTCSDIRFEHFNATNINFVESETEIVKITNESFTYSGFEYTGECFFTHQKLLFTLNIFFEKTLAKLFIRKEGLGLYTLIG